jgi:DNA-binding transcriptional MocR family regulator
MKRWWISGLTRPPPPLASFNPQATVITLGSAGKSFWGGLRLGWIRASSRTIATLAQTRDTLDLGSPLLEQLATLWLINNSERFLPARRKMLAERAIDAVNCCVNISRSGHSMRRKAGFLTG